jgi:hypothetical protein
MKTKKMAEREEREEGGPTSWKICRSPRRTRRRKGWRVQEGKRRRVGW